MGIYCSVTAQLIHVLKLYSNHKLIDLSARENVVGTVQLKKNSGIIGFKLKDETWIVISKKKKGMKPRWAMSETADGQRENKARFNLWCYEEKLPQKSSGLTSRCVQSLL